MRRLVLALLAIAATAVAAHASPPTWSIARGSFGLNAQGVIEKDNASALFVGPYLSYSLTSGLSVAGNVEYDFARDFLIGRGGARFLIFKNERGQVGLGADLVGYSGERADLVIQKPTSWQASVNGSWSAFRAKDGTTLLWGIASASFDPENDYSRVNIGLRYQLLGGRPYLISESPQP